ncbi:MAG: Type II secretion system protein G precursor [Elusimicrobia bacterium ADurb.Bin231]|nr:MAG: Type II secretion system protein G precursor [Elusimicrobia bacterium ADurb.Bin231]
MNNKKDTKKNCPSANWRIKAGFTLIELMIVVTVIGILSAIAIPKFINMTRKSTEAATKGNLATLRSAISIYYSENEGTYPANTESAKAMEPTALYTANITYLQNTLIPKYVNRWPVCHVPPHHNKTDTVDEYSTFAQLDVTCDGEWAYIGNGDDTKFGHIFVECWHKDINDSYISGW